MNIRNSFNNQIKVGINGYIYLCLLFFFFVACSNSKDVLIVIGKEEITKKELVKLFKEHPQQNTAAKANFISQLIESRILEKESEKMGISLQKEEIDSFIKESGLSEKHIQVAKLFLLRQKVADILIKEVEPSQEKINEILSQVKDVEPKKFVFQQVLLNKEEKAHNVLEEIKKGVSFDDAAKAYSLSPEGKRGGLVDYLYADELPQELSKALKNMKPGDVSGIIKSAHGFHIIKLKEVIETKKLSEEEKLRIAKEQAKKELTGDSYADWFAKKRKEYNVTVKWEKIENIN